MQKINKQKGSVSMIVSVLVVIVVIGGGVYLYAKNPKINQTTNENITGVETFSADDPVFATSPKGIFLERNQALYDAQSFDEMMAVSRKYDTQARQVENDNLFKSASSEKKDAYFGFAQALMIPNSEYTQISETLEGDTAVVNALDSRKQKTTAFFIKENGVWKIDNIKTMLTGSNN